MCSSALRLVLAAALVAAALVPRAARACSVCLAGDPYFSTHGSASQEPGTVSVYLELRGWEKTSGSGAGAPAAPAPAAAPGGESAVRDAPIPRLRRPGGPDGASPAKRVRARGFGPRHDHAGHGHPGDEYDDEYGDETTPEAGAADPSPARVSTRERNASERLDLYVAWAPLDRLTLTFAMPWAFNGIDEDGGDDGRSFSLSGFGDASVAASAVVWRNRPVLPSTWLETRAWLKAPTGRDERRVDGVQDAHLQAGTGSWDFGFGLAGVHKLPRASLYASAFYRVNTEGGLDYAYGDVLLTTLAIEAPLGHLTGLRALDRLTPGLSVDFRFAERDRQGGRAVEDTGGGIAYLTPSLRLALPGFGERGRAWLRTGVQIPATQAWLHDEQDEGAVWSIGLGYGF